MGGSEVLGIQQDLLQLTGSPDTSGGGRIGALHEVRTDLGAVAPLRLAIADGASRGLAARSTRDTATLVQAGQVTLPVPRAGRPERGSEAGGRRDQRRRVRAVRPGLKKRTESSHRRLRQQAEAEGSKNGGST